MTPENILILCLMQAVHAFFAKKVQTQWQTHNPESSMIIFLVNRTVLNDKYSHFRRPKREILFLKDEYDIGRFLIFDHSEKYNMLLT